MKTFCVALVLCMLGCRSAPPPVIEDPGVPPLPPASGTPIGILLDEAERLSLRPEQREKLAEIDHRLATRNEQLDGKLRASSNHAGPPAGGQRGGPRRGRGMGGMGGGGRRRGGAQHQPPDGQPPGQQDPKARSRATDEILANKRAALEEAMAALDARQRSLAEAIFKERGIAIDAQPVPETPEAVPAEP